MSCLPQAADFIASLPGSGCSVQPLSLASLDSSPSRGALGIKGISIFIHFLTIAYRNAISNIKIRCARRHTPPGTP